MNTLSAYDDARLVALLQEGSSDAFDEIYRRYHAVVYRNIYKLTKDHVATEDLLQDTFVAFWQKKERINAARSVTGWLFVISYNLSVNWLKHKLVESKATAHLITVATEPIAELVGDYEEQMRLIEKAILSLSPQKKRVLELCKLQGRSYKAAAKEMKISSHTVKEYLSVALKSVREYASSGIKLFFLLLFFL